MYCMNCGKEIGGNIPICGECLQSVLDKYKVEQDVLTRVNLKAQPFVVDKKEVKPISEESKIVVEESEETKHFLPDAAWESPGAPLEQQQYDEPAGENEIIVFAVILGLVLLCILLCVIAYA